MRVAILVYCRTGWHTAELTWDGQGWIVQPCQNGDAECTAILQQAVQNEHDSELWALVARELVYAIKSGELEHAEAVRMLPSGYESYLGGGRAQ